MGIAVGGVIFVPSTALDVSALNSAFRLNLEQLDDTQVWSMTPKFDPRKQGDFIINRGPKHLCIMNSAVSDDLFFKRDMSCYDRISKAFDASGKIIFFCLYDSGGSHGFAVFENGRLLRQRLYTEYNRQSESGVPHPAEADWEKAILTSSEMEDYSEDLEEGIDLFRHMPSQSLQTDCNANSLIVDAVLKAEFGWSPLDDDIVPTEYSYYRSANLLAVADIDKAAESSESEAGSLRKIWMKLFG
jgi:hypothetical protein